MIRETVYQVSASDGPPAFDSVPVAKIVNYPLEQRDYRPFAQSILCLGGGRLFLRMWAFEVSVMPGSALECVMYPFPQRPERAVHIRFAHGEADIVAVTALPMERGEDIEPGPEVRQALSQGAQLHPHNGEDLQGAYWGMTLSLPVGALEALGGETALLPGGRFPGNFYKTCDHQRFAHKGSLFPADFMGGPYLAESMGVFQVVPY